MPVAVLVIDDDEDIRATLAEILAAEGFQPLEAGNGREGLTILATTRPRVILLDLMMPVMNGWQFREEQRRQPALADIPVIVITAYDAPRIDAARVLRKPFDLEQLVGTVRSLSERVSA